MLGEGFGSARVFLEGPDSADSSWLVFALLSLAAAGSVCDVGGQKFLIREDISVVGENSSGHKSSLDICRSGCKVLIIPGKS